MEKISVCQIKLLLALVLILQMRYVLFLLDMQNASIPYTRKQPSRAVFSFH